jgi:3-deoxy-manno-octulosonate cytidylyltransferase (CMP-KDO synthetase)
VIPVRFASTRLPGKPLLKANGRSILRYVYANAVKSGAQSVTIATDDERIREHALEFDADVVMTRSEHDSGTDRIAEAARLKSWDANDVIVNLQGDEPQMDARNICQVATLLYQHPQAQMATLCAPITDDGEINNPNCVKVVLNKKGHALYFSRSPIPYARQVCTDPAHRHLGIYAYRVGYLQEFSLLLRGRLERCENLEQLRALENGHCIAIAVSEVPPGIGIDTDEDFQQFCRLMKCST